MRTPFQQAREPARAGLRRELAEGFRYLWHQPFLRTCAFLYGLGNFTLPGVFLVVIVVVGRRAGASPAAGSACSSPSSARPAGSARCSPGPPGAGCSMRTILRIELVTWLGTAAYVAWPDVYVLVGRRSCPRRWPCRSTDSAVVGYRVAVTPDHLLGRSESVRGAISWCLTPLGPLAAGLLLEAVSPRETIAAFTLVSVVLFAWGMASPSIRHAPSLDELAGLT